MNAIPLKAAIRYLAGWSVMVFFIVLLTLIFNFLGTIICAALAGMMLGAGRVARWHTFVISIFFPACIFGVLRTTKADLLGWQILMLTLLCFTVFWVSYISTTALLFFESKGVAPQPQATGPGRTKPAVPCVVPARVAQELTLAALEGDWRCKARVNGDFQDKLLEIHEQRLSLSVAEHGGRLRLVGQAKLEFGGNGTGPHLSVAASNPAGDDWVCI